MRARVFILLFCLVASLILALNLAAADPQEWIRDNTGGFGEIDNVAVLSLASFADYLYAGTGNNSGNGAQLWRRNGEGEWERITASGFADPANTQIASLAKFNDRLYAGTQNETSGGQVWRSDDGLSWNKIVFTIFDPSNTVIVHFTEFDNKIYASTQSSTLIHGAEIWHSSTGDSGDWTPSAGNGFDGDGNNSAIVSFEEFGGHLFAGTVNEATGCEIWAMDDDGDWIRVNTDGFGDPYNRSVTLKAFKGTLFAGTYNYSGSDNPGHELWRCQLCDGSDWQMVPIPKGFGTTENRAIRALEVLNGALYAVTYNEPDGVQVWRSTDGEDWGQVNASGFGDNNNAYVLWDNATVVYNGTIYVGTFNEEAGGELWRYLSSKVFLPTLMWGDQ